MQHGRTTCQVIASDYLRLPLITSDSLWLHAAWSDYLPASHLSTAAVIVLFKLADRKSYEEAKRFCDEATKLARVQVIASDCL
jgi:hypothetical protein